MTDQLPYKLGQGITATQEGIVVDIRRGDIYGLIREWTFSPRVNQDPEGLLVKWIDAAEHLQYQEGKPWCTSSDGSFTVDIVCRAAHVKPLRNAGSIFGETIKDNPLHRLAVILCDTAEAFRLLHWCIYNLTQQQALDELVEESQQRGDYD